MERWATTACGRPRRALVVEAVPARREGLARALEEAGWEAVEADDGVEALELLDAARPGDGEYPHAVLVGALQGTLSPLDLAAEVRRTDACVPVLVVPASLDPRASVGLIGAAA